MKNYSLSKIIASAILFGLLMMQPANKTVSQVMAKPDSSLKEKENTVIKKSVDKKSDAALDILKEAAKNVDAVIEQKVKIVYKTKIKTVRDTIWYPLPVDSSFDDYANQPDTVRICRIDTVYFQKVEPKKGLLKRVFNF